MFEIRFSHKAEKFFKNCEPKIKERVRNALEVVRENPLPAKLFDFKKIKGEDGIVYAFQVIESSTKYFGKKTLSV